MPGHYGNGNGNRSNVQTNRRTRAGQFVNRTTGIPVPPNMPYHVHNGQAMAGATHSDTPHDFYDVPGRTNRSANTMRTNNMRRSGTRSSIPRTNTTRRTMTSMSSGYRRGGRVGRSRRRQFQTGGMHTHNTTIPSHTHQYTTQIPGNVHRHPLPDGTNTYFSHASQYGTYISHTSGSQDHGGQHNIGTSYTTTSRPSGGRHYHNSGISSVPQRRRGGRMRKMSHGGSHSRNNGCGPGMMYQNGGCVPASGGMRKGGNIRRMEHGGQHHLDSDHARKTRRG